ncbi:MAG: YnbE family lipoprotein [Nitrosomonas sp.]|nr:MAG: YnbE family lipoprotein [Nitrosomonas sp.]
MKRINLMINKAIIKALLLLVCVAVTSCAPTVKVETPSEPITINLNIKLDADIRVKLEDEAKKDIAANPGIF